jgi:hypothetical protein
MVSCTADSSPSAGAHIYLFTPNTTGYGGNGIAPSSLNASLSLLNVAVLNNTAEPSNPGGLDGSFNYYVKTDATGGFTISADYSCTSADAAGRGYGGYSDGLGAGISLCGGRQSGFGHEHCGWIPGFAGSMQRAQFQHFRIHE